MIRGLLFDLDGVLVNTNPLHARAWQELAEELGIPFTPADQEAFLGISRAQCLEILLKKGNLSLSESEKERLCTRKNDRYREMIGTLTPAALLPGVSEFLRVARAEGYRTALGSVSKNAEFVLKKLEITAFFDAVIDGRKIVNGKRFSACGARIGCLISRNREFMANALKYCQARLSVATLDQIAAAALYSVGPEYFEQVRQEYKRRRDTVVRKLHEIPGVICECPRGAFYLMAALPVDDAEKFQLWLLQEFEDCGDTVMFSAGEPFYATPGKGRSEIRIAYVLKQEDLERAMDLLALGIRKYNETH